jgi:hypothetical protein
MLGFMDIRSAIEYVKAELRKVNRIVETMENVAAESMERHANRVFAKTAAVSPVNAKNGSGKNWRMPPPENLKSAGDGWLN